MIPPEQEIRCLDCRKPMGAIAISLYPTQGYRECSGCGARWQIRSDRHNYPMPEGYVIVYTTKTHVVCYRRMEDQK